MPGKLYPDSKTLGIQRDESGSKVQRITSLEDKATSSCSPISAKKMLMLKKHKGLILTNSAQGVNSKKLDCFYKFGKMSPIKK